MSFAYHFKSCSEQLTAYKFTHKVSVRKPFVHFFVRKHNTSQYFHFKSQRIMGTSSWCSHYFRPTDQFESLLLLLSFRFLPIILSNNVYSLLILTSHGDCFLGEFSSDSQIAKSLLWWMPRVCAIWASEQVIFRWNIRRSFGVISQLSREGECLDSIHGRFRVSPKWKHFHNCITSMFAKICQSNLPNEISQMTMFIVNVYS